MATRAPWPVPAPGISDNPLAILLPVTDNHRYCPRCPRLPRPGVFVMPSRDPHRPRNGGDRTRRAFLHAAGLGGLGLFWADWVRAELPPSARGKGRAKAVILIFNAGAPSPLDLWDPKPDAPA